jgi:hypothetical protein
VTSAPPLAIFPGVGFLLLVPLKESGLAVESVQVEESGQGNEAALATVNGAGLTGQSTIGEGVRSLGGALTALRVPLLMLVASQVADLVTTYGILVSGGREGNPASAYLLARGGFAALVFTKAALSSVTVLSAVALVARGFECLARPALAGVILVHALVILSNVYQLATFA